MAKQLQDEGLAVGRDTGRRLMTAGGVEGQCRSRRRPQTPASRHGFGVAPHLLERRCDGDRPQAAWGGDVTSLWTAEGWVSLSVLVDWYARKVVGWAMRDHLDPKLVTHAVQMALGQRQPAQGLLHHSDRGSQYASHAYRGLLSPHGIQCRRSRKGDWLDNAVAERFCGSLQRAWTGTRFYATRQEARDEVSNYIERCYNSRRKHSYLGSVSPNAYEKIALVA